MVSTYYKKYLILKKQSYCLNNQSYRRPKRPGSAKPSVSILSTADYERIKQNARISAEDELKNQQKILQQQKNCQLAKARAHIDTIKQIDKNRPKYPLSQGDKEKKLQGNSILAAAKRAKENGLDETKEMDQLLKYAKVVSIRDLQKKEHRQMEVAYKEKENKLDLMMELERLKELKYQEDKEKEKKNKRLQSARIIVSQIKENEIKRLQERENKIREGELMKKQIKAMQEEELRNEEKKRLENLRLAKEIENINKISELNKDKKKLMEKEEDLKRLKYNMEKAKKEEEEIAEKKRIQAQKERETQKMREKQEKFADKQALLDELRAKRAYEEAERKAREKEIEEMKKLERQKMELIEGNEVQKMAKKNRLQEQAMAEQKEYQDIIKKQIADMEEDRRQEEIRKNIYNSNGEALRRQMREKAEKKRVLERGILEEGRQIKMEQDEYRKTLERIKKEKLDEMERYHIDPKYRVDLQKYKIH